MSKNLPISNPLGNQINYGTEYQEPDQEQAPQKKRRVGRPKTKTEPVRKITVAIPESLMEQVDIAKLCYNNNLTLYFAKVIERDLQVNMERYRELTSLNNFMN